MVSFKIIFIINLHSNGLMIPFLDCEFCAFCGKKSKLKKSVK